jgi:hypothetical protein
MFKVKSWFKTDVILLSVAFVALLVTVTPMVAHAEGFKAMGLAKRMVLAASPNNIVTYQSPNGDSANQMPKGYLMYTASGDACWVRRNTTARTVFETNATKIPADEELILTPLNAVASGDTAYVHTFEVVGTVGDTLIYFGLWR